MIRKVFVFLFALTSLGTLFAAEIAELNKIKFSDVPAITPNVNWQKPIAVPVNAINKSATDQYYSLLHPTAGSSVVIDRRTDLMWISNQDDMGFGPGARLMWRTAKQACDTLVYAGYSDWRLPDYDELGSIVETNTPSINHAFFPNTWCDHYWTSTPSIEMGFDYRMTREFTHYGAPYSTPLAVLASVRCVRSIN